MKSVLELPLERRDYPGSKLGFVAVLKSAFDLVTIYRKYK